MKAGLLIVAAVVLQCCVVVTLSHAMGMGHERRPFPRILNGRHPGPPMPPGIGFTSMMNDLQNSLQQQLANFSRGSRTVPLSVEKGRVAWNRTVEGVRVFERGYYENNGVFPMLSVVSRDSRLVGVNFTGAATLYVFGENGTAVILKPGFRRRRRPQVCFLLPDRNITYNDTMDLISARNNTDIPAPVTVERLNATGTPMDWMEALEIYRNNPALYFFCRFTRLVQVSPADDAAFPTSSETERERVLRMITLDRELQVLVPKRASRGRPPARGGPARPRPRPRPRPRFPPRSG